LFALANKRTGNLFALANKRTGNLFALANRQIGKLLLVVVALEPIAEKVKLIAIAGALTAGVRRDEVALVSLGKTWAKPYCAQS
jgi:hypothetical protein